MYKRINIIRLDKLQWPEIDGFSVLSRRQHRFESGRGRQLKSIRFQLSRSIKATAYGKYTGKLLPDDVGQARTGAVQTMALWEQKLASPHHPAVPQNAPMRRMTRTNFRSTSRW